MATSQTITYSDCFDDGCETAIGGNNIVVGNEIAISNDVANTITIGDNYNYTAINPYCFSGTSSVSSYGTIVSIDKSTIYGEHGQILMDLEKMIFKIYDSENGWIEYDIEDFKTLVDSSGKKRIVSTLSKSIEISEIKKENKKRKVFVEKFIKHSNIIISSFYGFTSHTGTNTIPYNNYGITYTGDGNYLISASAIATTTISSAGNLTIGLA